MKTPFEFICHYLFRSLALILDLFFATATVSVIFSLIFLTSSIINCTSSKYWWLFTYLSISLTLLGWSAYEAREGSSPGHYAMGLQLDIKGSYPTRFLVLLIRNLLKFGQVYLSIHLSFLLRDLLISNSILSHDNVWFILLVPILIWLTISLGLCGFKTNRHLHDWASGTRVGANSEPPSIISRGMQASGLFASSVILIFLSAALFPSYVGCNRGGEKNSSVKANMYTLQTIVETYAVDWGGVYPPHLKALKLEATKTGRDYWKEFTNPYTGKSGESASYTDADHSRFQAGDSLPNADEAGLVLYAPVGEKDIVKYFIYGLDKAGRALVDRGHDFTLSNN